MKPRDARGVRGAMTAFALVVGAQGVPAAHAAELDGRWVLVQRMTTAASVPVIGEIEAKTTVVSLHDASDAAGRLRGVGVLCHIAIDSGTSLVETVLPEAFRRSLPPPLLDAEIVRDGAGMMSLRQATRAVVVGAALKSPWEPLPRTASDRRVVDQDRDGKPGVTISVRGIVTGDLHVVQRSWTRFEGPRGKDGSFGGRLEFGTDQVVLGSTSPFLGDAPRGRPLVDKSWFRVMRVPPGTSCVDALRATRRSP